MPVNTPHSSGIPLSRAHQVVLVTGSSRGIGRAIAVEFARARWRVGVHGRERRHEADETASLVTAAGGEPRVYQADLRNARLVQNMVDDVVARWGHIDVLVCSAGVAASHLTIRHPETAWLDTVETNLTGAFHCLRASGAHMVARGEGSIIFVGSFAGLQGRAGQAAYAASKAGLLGLAKAAAREWGPHGIRINVLLPGWQRTELVASTFPEDAEDRPAHILEQLPTLEDVARTAHHLALLRGTSGQVWHLDSRIL